MRIISRLRLPYREDRLFGILWITSLLVPLAFSLFTVENYEVIKLGILTVLMGWAVYEWAKQIKEQAGEPAGVLAFRARLGFFIILGLFWAWSLLSAVFAWDRNYSFFGFYPRFTNGVWFYTLWAVLVILLTYINKDKLWHLLRLLIFCSGLMAIWGMAQSLGFGYYAGLSITDFFSRAPGFLGNPNFTSMFMIAMLPMAAAALWQSKKFWHRVYYALNIFFCIWTTVILSSRGALLALIAGLAVGALLSLAAGRKYKMLSAIFFTALLLTFAFSKLFLNLARPDTVKNTVTMQDTNVKERLAVWNLAGESMQKRPWLGVGLGNFQLMFEHERGKDLFVSTAFFDDAHNLYLQLGATGGIPLLLFFLLLIILAGLNGMQNIRTENALGAVGALAGLAGWSVATLFTPVPVACYVLLAFLLACLFFEPGVTIKPTLNPAVILPIKALGVLLGLFGLAFLASQHLIFFGEKAFYLRNYPKAHMYVSVAAFLSPFDNTPYVFKGASAIMLGKSQAEINKALDQARTMHPLRSYTYVQQANLNYLRLYKTQDPAFKENIKQNLAKAAEADIYSAPNYFLAGQYYYVFGEVDQAKEFLKTGLAIDGKSYEAWMLLAKVYQELGKKQGMVSSLEKAYKLEPGNQKVSQVLRDAKGQADIKKLPLSIKVYLGRID